MSWENEIKAKIRYSDYLSTNEILNQKEKLVKELHQLNKVQHEIILNYFKICRDCSLGLRIEESKDVIIIKKESCSIGLILNIHNDSLDFFFNDKLIDSVLIDLQENTLKFKLQSDRPVYQFKHIIGKHFMAFLDQVLTDSPS